MSNLRMILDDGGFTFFLDNVKGGKLKSALKSGVRKSLNIIKKQVVSNLRNLQFKSGQLDINKPVKFKNSYGSDYTLPSFKQGVLTRAYRDGGGGVITISPKNRTKNNFILAMMENSKGIRRTKGRNDRKAHSTGSIKKDFFRIGLDAKRDEAHRTLEQHLHDAITKARNNFYK